VHPLPLEAIRAFAAQVETLYIVEELDPIIEAQVRAAGIPCVGKERFPLCGEFSPAIIAHGLGLPAPAEVDLGALAQRPPAMCPSCPHRGVFWVLKRLWVTVTGDIGCYTLGVAPPLGALDTCVCMGASIGVARGLEQAGVDPGKVVGVIGDSTFLHSGITGLLDMVYNRSHCSIMILDNGTTAMTGQQEHPGTGKTLDGASAPQVDLEGLVRALGVQDVQVLDPYELEALDNGVKHALAFAGPSVIIARRPCMLIPHEDRPDIGLTEEACKFCGACLRLGCPAITKDTMDVDGKTKTRPAIDRMLCEGCAVCASVCPFGALSPAP
jgi:indolepyruvate ferredoxin oxidoreductase alpha subunit